MIYFSTMFFICMVCHGELMRLRPDPRRLTAYYLLMSAGGALGGVFVSLVAPLIFTTFFEWPLGLVLSFLVAAVAIALAAVPRSVPLWLKLVLLAGGAAGAALVVLVRPISQAFYEWPLGLVLAFLVAAVAVTAAAASPTAPRGLKLAMAVSLGTVTVLGLGLLLQLLLVLPSHARSSKGITVERARNFFGIVSIRDYRRDEPDEHQYVMRHGAIEHGEQFVDPAKRHIPLTYYRYDSGVGRTIMHLQKQRPTMRVGVVGLGAAPSPLTPARATAIASTRSIRRSNNWPTTASISPI